MKRFARMISLILSALLPVALPMPCATAANSLNPFEAGTLLCERFRIPAILKLQDGSVIAAADLRWNHRKH